MRLLIASALHEGEISLAPMTWGAGIGGVQLYSPLPGSRHCACEPSDVFRTPTV
jgi:hypothetical protein